MTETNMRVQDLRELDLDRRTLAAALPRAAADHSAVLDLVRPILERVRTEGLAAVAELTERFDHVRPASFRVPAAALERAARDLDPAVDAALDETILRARAVARENLPSTVTTVLGSGAEVSMRWLPVDRVGLYVPGGLAVYPSTVVMNVVPALEAGVASVALVSPPQADGLPSPTVLATAHKLGISEVWAMGGAQAIAALAYGFSGEESLEPVDVITGPGNAFVAAAKSLVSREVGIDAIAGPTEIIVLADGGADPRFVAADLISQAEHDPLAASVLVTDSTALVDAVRAELSVQVAEAKHRERIEQALSGEQSGILLVSDLEAGIAVTNAYAGEHVEVLVADAARVASRITAGGSVFVGPYSPVALGDYCSGSNHVLPTMGSAAYSSALSVMSFLKGSQLVDYSASALAEVSGHIVALAEAEDLPAHGRAVAVRGESRD